MFKYWNSLFWRQCECVCVKEHKDPLFHMSSDQQPGASSRLSRSVLGLCQGYWAPSYLHLRLISISYCMSSLSYSAYWISAQVNRLWRQAKWEKRLATFKKNYINTTLYLVLKRKLIAGSLFLFYVSIAYISDYDYLVLLLSCNS